MQYALINAGFDSDKVFKNVNDTVMVQLHEFVVPESSMNGYEYMALIDVSDECVHIFYANDIKACKCREGSTISQLIAGAAKIGFIDLHDPDICESIKRMIHEFWEEMCKIVDRERCFMYRFSKASL